MAIRYLEIYMFVAVVAIDSRYILLNVVKDGLVGRRHSLNSYNGGALRRHLNFDPDSDDALGRDKVKGLPRGKK